MRYTYDNTRPAAPAPRLTWWQAMPWLVRAAIWVTALMCLLPLALLLLGGTAVGVLLWLGALL